VQSAWKHASNEIWNDTDSRYQRSIEGLSDNDWKLIATGARKISRERKGIHVASGGIADQNKPDIDEGMPLIEGDQTVENDDEIDWDACETFCYYLQIKTNPHSLECASMFPQQKGPVFIRLVL
jgi:hypothetical protein